MIGSNVYSPQETTLFRWLEVHYEKIKPQTNAKRIKNLQEDIIDGHIFSSLVISYVEGNV